MKRNVLYVDDEMDNLVVFRATFGRDFNVSIANSGQRALELMQQQSFPVVLADQRMPHMTGAALFQLIRRLHPHTRRVMVTGYVEPKAMIDAINEGQVYYFIKKPWEPEAVLSVVKHSIEAYDLSMSNMALTDRLVAVDRCATLGRSAARVAHEMSNQLGCMLPLLELIEDNRFDHDDLVDTASFARKTYDQLVQLLNEVKAFVRLEHEQLALQPVVLSEVVHELVQFLRYDNTLPSPQVSVQVAAEPVVKANRFKLQQVLINLLKNAAYAIRGRADGRIAVTLQEDGGYAILSVIDNGCGMSPETAARIWEPFFTTKGQEGTGLGLDICKAIIEAHGGQIHCRTALGSGAEFSIRFPLAESPRVPAISLVGLQTPALVEALA